MGKKKSNLKRIGMLALATVIVAGQVLVMLPNRSSAAEAKKMTAISQEVTEGNLIQNAAFDTSANWDGYAKMAPYSERKGDGTVAADFNGDGSANIKPSTKGSQGLTTNRWLRQTFKTVPGVYYTVQAVTENVDISFSDGAYSTSNHGTSIATETKDDERVFKAVSEQTTITLTAKEYGTGITSASVAGLSVVPFEVKGNLIKNAIFDTSVNWDGYTKVGSYSERKKDGTAVADFNGDGSANIKPSTKGSQGLTTNRWLRQTFKTVPGVYYTVQAVTENVDISFSDGAYSTSNHGTSIATETKDGELVFKAVSEQTTITLTAKKYGTGITSAYVAGLSVVPFEIKGNLIKNAAFHTSTNWDGYTKMGSYSERKGDGTVVATFNDNASVDIKPSTKGSQGLTTKRWLRQTLTTEPGRYYVFNAVGSENVDFSFSDGAYTTSNHGKAINLETINGERIFQAESEQTTITLTAQRYGTGISSASAWGLSVVPIKVELTIDPIKATDTNVTGTASPNSLLQLFDVTNGKMEPISDTFTAGADGQYQAELSKTLSGGTNVMVRPVYDQNSGAYTVVTGLGQMQINNMDNPSWIYKTGVTKGKYHDRQALGFILPAGSTLRARQANPDYSGSLTIRLIGAGRSLDEQKTVGKDWVELSNAAVSVPFVSTPYTTGGVLEYEIVGGKPLPTIMSGSNKQDFVNEWDKTAAEFILLKSKSVQMLVNERDKASFIAMSSFNGSIDAYIAYLEDIFTSYNKYLGLDGSSAINQNGNNRYLILNNSGGKNPTYGANYINRPGLSKFFVERNWGILHEIGHGYQASYGNGYLNGLGEVSNNIFASLFLYDRYGKGALGSMDKQDTAFYQHYITDGGGFGGSQYKLEMLMLMIQKAGEDSFIKMNQAYRQVANEPNFSSRNYPLENLINKYYSENSKFDFSPFLQRIGAPIVEAQAASNRSNGYKGIAALADIVPKDQLDKARALADPKSTFVNSDFELVTNDEISALGLKGSLEIQLSSEKLTDLKGNILQIKDGNQVVQEQVIGDTGKLTFTDVPNGVYSVNIENADVTLDRAYVYVKEDTNTATIQVTETTPNP